MQWDDIVAADPDVIVVAPCGYDLARCLAELPLLQAKPGWAGLAAVRSAQVYFADGNAYFNRPGPRLADTADILAEILHPDVAGRRHEGTAWVRCDTVPCLTPLRKPFRVWPCRGRRGCGRSRSMPNTLRKPPPRMTVADFIEWPGDGTGGRSQLIDGEVREIPLGSVARGLIHTNVNYLVASHLKAADGPYSAFVRPSIVPRLRAGLNLRAPALGVAAAPDRSDQYIVPDPILLIEILTPENTTDVWGNVWSYCTIPSVQEVALVHSTRVLAELLRRGRDGHWPEEPEEIGPDGMLSLASIGLACPLLEVYAHTLLGRDKPT